MHSDAAFVFPLSKCVCAVISLASSFVVKHPEVKHPDCTVLPTGNRLLAGMRPGQHQVSPSECTDARSALLLKHARKLDRSHKRIGKQVRCIYAVLVHVHFYGTLVTG